MALEFGAGSLWLTPIIKSNGTDLRNQTPVQVAELQEFSVDIDVDLKMQYGKGRYPIAIAGGKSKISCKGKHAVVSARALDIVMGGSGMVSGKIGIAEVVSATIPATPFKVTPAVPGAGVYDADLGVRGLDGFPFKRVDATPATKQYMVNTTTGEYTFSGADTGVQVLLSLRYTKPSIDGGYVKQTITNTPMGGMPRFRADYFSEYDGDQTVFVLYCCVAGKWGLSRKQDDFTSPEFNIEAMEEPLTRRVYDFSMASI